MISQVRFLRRDINWSNIMSYHGGGDNRQYVSGKMSRTQEEANKKKREKTESRARLMPAL
jgi:hypothetical protein